MRNSPQDFRCIIKKKPAGWTITGSPWKVPTVVTPRQSGLTPPLPVRLCTRGWPMREPARWRAVSACSTGAGGRPGRGRLIRHPGIRAGDHLRRAGLALIRGTFAWGKPWTAAAIFVSRSPALPAITGFGYPESATPLGRAGPLAGDLLQIRSRPRLATARGEGDLFPPSLTGSLAGPGGSITLTVVWCDGSWSPRRRHGLHPPWNNRDHLDLSVAWPTPAWRGPWSSAAGPEDMTHEHREAIEVSTRST